jgi:hypothetical protein
MLKVNEIFFEGAKKGNLNLSNKKQVVKTTCRTLENTTTENI